MSINYCKGWSDLLLPTASVGHSKKRRLSTGRWTEKECGNVKRKESARNKREREKEHEDRMEGKVEWEMRQARRKWKGIRWMEKTGQVQ
jgi:hypothetical protein